jgi:hypothetical protein
VTRSRVIRTRLASGFILATLCLAACDKSSGPNGGGHGPVVDPCLLLTRAEAESILAKPVLATRKDTSDYILTCTYSADADVRVQLKAFTAEGAQASQGAGSTFTPAAYLANLRTALDASGWEAITGVGTDAIWATRQGKLTFYKGDVVAEALFSPLGKAIDTSSAARAGAISAGSKITSKL